MEAKQDDGTQARLRYRRGAKEFVNAAFYTGLLTVWRKLHVERDSMEAVPQAGPEKNFVSGNIPGDPVQEDGNWKATTDQNLLDDDMYENGTLTKGGSHTVTASPNCNSSGANSWVVLTTNPGSGGFSGLTDDDEKVMPDYPDLGKMDAIFKDCYIEHVDDGGGNAAWKTNDVPFDLNIDDAVASDADITTALRTNDQGNPGRNSSGAESGDFWVVYVQGAYQEGWDKDNDPDTEAGRGGHTSANRQGCLMFLETIRDRVVEHPGQDATVLEQQIVVHEVGHQFALDHLANTIMNQSLPVDAAYEKFGPAHINEIRGRTASPGS